MKRRSYLACLGGVVGSAGLAYKGADMFGHSSRGHTPTVIGHRGARGLTADNTLHGIRLARKHGADGVELDVRQTRDEKLVLHHNPIVQLDTTTVKNVDQVSYNKIQSRGSDHRPVPTLDQALSLIRDLDNSFQLYVELKADVSKRVAEKISSYGLSDQTTAISFDQNRLQPFTESDRGFLTTIPVPEHGAEIAHQHDCDFLSGYMVPEVQEEYVTVGEKEELDIGLWSLYDTRQRLEWAYNTGADVLIVNRPDIMRDIINRRA